MIRCRLRVMLLIFTLMFKKLHSVLFNRPPRPLAQNQAGQKIDEWMNEWMVFNRLCVYVRVCVKLHWSIYFFSWSRRRFDPLLLVHNLSNWTLINGRIVHWVKVNWGEKVTGAVKYSRTVCLRKWLEFCESVTALVSMLHAATLWLTCYQKVFLYFSGTKIDAHGICQ